MFDTHVPFYGPGLPSGPVDSGDEIFTASRSRLLSGEKKESLYCLVPKSALELFDGGVGHEETRERRRFYDLSGV